MVDGPAPRGANVPAGTAAVGRTRTEAPEVDGLVLLSGRAAAKAAPGDVIPARIEAALDYDLLARAVPLSGAAGVSRGIDRLTQSGAAESS
jgi:hypothetical protein